ncbi:hypothetical protein GII40_00108 [Candidatus Profftia lariciata]|uniref:oxygen-dependent tRNA uridine(34) hydroxylase TrhO n=1 Tax=Candidatus Profftia lariciata TaxID=1987921 RepID=UPI001D02A5D9|nr:rhodanese-related sulfurtransferase [Candidatus Profftia lariciata]UDG81333.1 hypothetical protein GII40_00108 [Candidatus Profftia lariciata]
MLVLHNTISNKILKKRMLSANELRTTVSFYKYCYIDDQQKLRDKLYATFYQLRVFGRIYIAHEGINAQISVPTIFYKKMKTTLYQSCPQFNNLRMNVAIDDNGKSFWVLRIKIRDRIVADGINDPNFNLAHVGQYLQAKEVNVMLNDPNAIFVDIRNDYEYEIGHFMNAITIPSKTFRDQLPMMVEMLKNKKDKKIVMYCTGGIRCEKASAYMLYKGFNNVYHVAGGIIEYVRNARTLGLPIYFIGKNFVFDERMGERITNEIISYCHQCGVSCDTHVNCLNHKCHLLFIQCSSCSKKYNKYCSLQCLKIMTEKNKIC